MLKLFFGLCFFSFGAAVCYPSVICAQQSTARSAGVARVIPFNSDNWSFHPGTVEFQSVAPAIGGVSPIGSAMKISGRNSGAVVAKNIDFSEGTSTSTFCLRIRILHLFIFTGRPRRRPRVFTSEPPGLPVIPTSWRAFNIRRSSKGWPAGTCYLITRVTPAFARIDGTMSGS